MKTKEFFFYSVWNSRAGNEERIINPNNNKINWGNHEKVLKSASQAVLPGYLCSVLGFN